MWRHQAPSTMPSCTTHSPSTGRDNHLENLKSLTVGLKKLMNLGLKTEPKIVKIDSYIDYLSKRCEQTGATPSSSQTPPLSTDVTAPQCRLEGTAVCNSKGYICFFLQGLRQREEVSPKPILFDLKVFLRHPEDGDPWMVGEKQFILKNNQKESSPEIVTTYKDIQRSNYVKNDTIRFWWQVSVRDYPKEIDLASTKETVNAIALEAKSLRELSKDCDINKIADIAEDICTRLEPSGVTEPFSFCYRIDNIENVLEDYKEMYTPLCQSPSHGYRFQGFLISREDNSLAAYLHLGPLKQMDEVIWPVKIRWKISLVDQARGKGETIGEMIYVYDKVTPADNSLVDFQSRIEFNKDKIESSGMIINQSLTVEWTVWLDSPIYAANAADLKSLCDQLLMSVEDILGPNPAQGDQTEIKTTDDAITNGHSNTQNESPTSVSGNFDLMLIGKSCKAKRVIGNSILQQHDFTKEQAEDAVKESWRQVDDHIVTVVDCPLMCNVNPEERDIPGTAGNRLASALVKSVDGFHAILFVFSIGKTFSHEEYESIQFLKTHLAHNAVRDFLICVMIHKNEPNAESEAEFDPLRWCKNQTGVFKDLLKECNYRCVLFNNTPDQLSVNETQRMKLLSLVNEMKSREFRLKKSRLDWSRIPGSKKSLDYAIDNKMEIILKKTHAFLQDLKAAREFYSDPVAAKHQIDELENKASLLEKDIATCNENSTIINTLKSTITQLKVAIASDRDIIKETQSLKDKIEQTTSKCNQLQKELDAQMEYKRKLQQAHVTDIGILRKTIDNLKFELEIERSSLKKYKEQYDALLSGKESFFLLQIMIWTGVYEAMIKKRQALHEQEIQKLQDVIKQQNAIREKTNAKDIEKLRTEIDVHKQEKDGLKLELAQMKKSKDERDKKWQQEQENLKTESEAIKKETENQQKLDAENMEKLRTEIEDHKQEKSVLKEELEKMKKAIEESDKRWQEEQQNLQTQSDSEIEDPDDEKMFQILNQSGYNVHAMDENGQTPLMKAAKEGYRKCVTFLIESQADVNIFDKDVKTALMFAAEKGSDKCVKLLIEANAGVNSCDNKGKTALMFAVEKQSEECVRLLIDAKSEVNKSDNSGKTALMFAVEKQFEECVKILIEGKCDVNNSDSNGKTALMLAAEKRSEKCMTMLIETEAEVNKCDKSGKTALMIAAMKGSFVCVKLLIDTDSNVNDCDTWGRTALMFAARKGSHECVRLLIEANSEVNKCEKIRRTALMFAAQRGSHECVKLLLEAKADVSKCDNGGKTAMVFAAEEGSHECVKLLNEAKSKLKKSEAMKKTAEEKGSDK